MSRVTFGPEIGYRFQAADGTYIEPHASITAIWDFDKSDVLVLGDEVVGMDDFRAKLQGWRSFYDAVWLHGSSKGQLRWDRIG